ncbi:ATP-binding cassette domain-containing protein [Limnobacter humi]|uniref:ATP-binding cassette domain-containing protein n=1 Tax=Limnobacter humi TaxID=1778671 RepID=A0ABT1WJV6_9BURK|nr:ATP-binding cassette domain-containing protein [Limnobacter humi]MCQ8897798.1 ATP-binding cassette domain-containing protein [Limnobacter humi]
MLKVNTDIRLLAPAVTSADLLPLTLRNISLRFRTKTVFDDFNLSLDNTGITAIMGPNGAGKSLALRLLAGLVKPDSGFALAGSSRYLPRNRFAMVFQRPVLLRRTVEGNLLHALKVAGLDATERPIRLAELLALGQLQNLLKSPARRLSGGEQQRLCLLRALASRPSVLFLDEPTASLDPQATALIEDLIRRVSACGVKVVVVTHDQGQAARIADEVVFIHQGRVLEKLPTPEFLKNPSTPQANAYLAGELLIH